MDPSRYALKSLNRVILPEAWGCKGREILDYRATIESVSAVPAETVFGYSPIIDAEISCSGMVAVDVHAIVQVWILVRIWRSAPSLTGLSRAATDHCYRHGTMQDTRPVCKHNFGDSEIP